MTAFTPGHVATTRRTRSFVVELYFSTPTNHIEPGTDRMSVSTSSLNADKIRTGRNVNCQNV